MANGEGQQQQTKNDRVGVVQSPRHAGQSEGSCSDHGVSILLMQEHDHTIHGRAFYL